MRKRNIPPLSNETASDLLKKNAGLYPQQAAFIFDEETFTWDDCEQLTDLIASVMMKKGMQKGEHVAFWSLNNIQTVLYMLACMKLGMVIATINYSYKGLELTGILNGADIKYLFLGENKANLDYLSIVESIHSYCTHLCGVFDMQKEYKTIIKAYHHGIRPEEETVKALNSIKASINAHDVFCILFTSGTTKTPKPVMLSYYNVVNDVYQFSARMETDHTDVLMAPLPLFHSSGMTGMLFNALVVGMTALIHRKFVAEEALHHIDKYRVTALMIVPSMMEMMLNCPEYEKYNISTLRVCQTSGSSTSPEKLRTLIQELGINHLVIGYGQTECSPLITTVLYDDDLVTVTETVGIPFPYEEVRIWNLDEDRLSIVGEPGEIQVKGFNTMKGYYKRDEENAKKFTADNWLKTTDFGFFDEKGYLHFVSRLSDIVIHCGENISLAELDFVIEQFSDDVLMVKTLGVKVDTNAQEEIVCFIQTKEEKIDPQKVQAFVKERLASFKVPKYVFQLMEFPMTTTKKIDRKKLQAIADELTK